MSKQTPEDLNHGCTRMDTDGKALEHVFELVDSTDEQCYYPMGLFLSMEEAVAWVMGCDKPCGEADAVARYEVRKRGIGFTGWSDQGKVVAKIQWEQRLDEETDEWVWQKPVVTYPAPKNGGAA